MMAATLGKNLQRQIGVMTMPVGKPRTVDSICLSVSICFKTHFSGNLLMLHEYKMLWHYAKQQYLQLHTNYA